MALLIDIGRGSKLWLAVGILVAAAVSLGSVTASARDDRDWHRDRDAHHYWHGGYYPAPPVVYGTPYLYTPPVVFGPGLGLSINIR